MAYINQEKTNTNIPQEINFVGKVEGEYGTTMLFLSLKYQISNLFNEASFKFVTRKLNIVNDQSNANYALGNEIIYSTESLTLIWLGGGVNFTSCLFSLITHSR